MMHHRHLAALVFVAQSLGFASGGPAFAECGKGKPIFEDTFQTLDPSWGISDEVLSADKGSLVLRPSADHGRFALSQTDFYGDGSLCVDVKVVESSDPGSTSVGVLFWALDYENLYEFDIGADSKQGFFKIGRLSKGHWLTPVAWTPSPAIKFKLGEANRVEIQIKGRTATVIVNDKQLTQFNGNPPDGGGLIGVSGWSPAAGPAKFAFQDIRFFAPAGFRP